MISLGTFAHGTGGIFDVTLGFPAAGLDWVYNIPARTRLRLLYGRISLQTSPVVATRRVQLLIENAEGILWKSANLAGQSNNTLQDYTIQPITGQNTNVAGFDLSLIIPRDTVLAAGDALSVQTTAIQAGDQWNPGFLRFEMWMEP